MPGPSGAPSVEPIWQEWLSLYLEHCRHTLKPQEESELAEAVARGASDLDSLTRLVSRHTADEGHWLVEFLDGVHDPQRHHVLVVETISRLRRDATTRENATTRANANLRKR